MVEKPTYPDRPTYLPTHPPQTFPPLLQDELAALRGQLAQLAQRVQALEQPPRLRPVAVTTVYDWED